MRALYLRVIFAGFADLKDRNDTFVGVVLWFGLCSKASKNHPRFWRHSGGMYKKPSHVHACMWLMLGWPDA